MRADGRCAPPDQRVPVGKIERAGQPQVKEGEYDCRSVSCLILGLVCGLTVRHICDGQAPQIARNQPLEKNRLRCQAVVDRSEEKGGQER